MEIFDLVAFRRIHFPLQRTKKDAAANNPKNVDSTASGIGAGRSAQAICVYPGAAQSRILLDRRRQTLVTYLGIDVPMGHELRQSVRDDKTQNRGKCSCRI